MKPCPCGSGRPYAECCEPYISGTQKPATAEALMRSRYTAYVEHAIDYIAATCMQDEKGKENLDLKETRAWSEESTWLGLKILAVTDGAAGDTEGTVEFEAASERDGLRDLHHERARFKKVDGQWFYDAGDIVPKTMVRATPKVGRNDPCPCGSGKKYKHCCAH